MRESDRTVAVSTMVAYICGSVKGHSWLFVGNKEIERGSEVLCSAEEPNAK